MGRKKLEIKKIEDKCNRQVTFSKRRSGLFKKVKQLSILCDVQIAVVAFSDRNKLYQFSHGNGLAAILRQYNEVSDTNGREATGIHEFKNLDCSKSQANRNHLQSVKRYLDELNLDQLTVDDLAQLEKELETALAQTRATKVSVNTQHMREPIKTLQEKEKLLREENELLTQKIAAMVKENIAGKELDNNREVNLAINEENHSPPQQTRWLLFE